MRPRWILSKFFRDPQNNLVPVAAAYGHKYRVPMHPATDDGSALVEIWAGAHQLDAAKQDDRIVLCPHLFDPSAAPDQVISAYAPLGAKAGMCMGSLLSALSDIEPIFAHTL